VLEGLVGPAVGADDGGSDGKDRGIGFRFLLVPEYTLEEGGWPAEGFFGGVAFSCVDQFKHGKINYGGGVGG